MLYNSFGILNPVSPIRTNICQPLPDLMMIKTVHTPKLVNEISGLMECLVCREKYYVTKKPGAEGNSLSNNWDCVNTYRLFYPN